MNHPSNNVAYLPPCETALEAQGLSVEMNRRAVLEDVDLRIAAGEVVAVRGANGAGKTTLLRCLAGLLRPGAGEVRWFGQSPRRNVAARRLIGLVAHQHQLYLELTPRENLLLAARLCGVAGAADRAIAWLDEAGLQRHADRPAAVLSHGMRQRLAVARALVHDPPIVLLDEPFSGLDEAAGDWLAAVIEALRTANRTLCFTTHDRRRAEQLADRVVVIAGGRLSPTSTDGFRAEAA